MMGRKPAPKPVATATAQRGAEFPEGGAEDCGKPGVGRAASPFPIRCSPLPFLLLDDFVDQWPRFRSGRRDVERVLYHLAGFFKVRIGVVIDRAEAFPGLNAVADLMLQNDADGGVD